jgi:hypothetical protein
MLRIAPDFPHKAQSTPPVVITYYRATFRKYRLASSHHHFSWAKGPSSEKNHPPLLKAFNVQAVAFLGQCPKVHVLKTKAPDWAI